MLLRCGGRETRRGVLLFPGLSERLRQPRLTQYGIGCVPARNADRHSEVPACSGAMPNLVTALALTHHCTASRTEQFTQQPIELRRHSGRGRLGFTQRGDLKE